MTREDWYRNETWGPEVEREFFAKLSRARTQRDQYLVIQALSLVDKEPQVALRLIDQYFDTRTTEYDTLRALVVRAEAYVVLGDLTKAVEWYKAALRREDERPNNLSDTYIALPFLIAQSQLRDEYDYALELLIEHKERLTFPIDHFRWQASCALILEAQGLSDLARDHARLAVQIAGIRKSGFRYHQDLGLVGRRDDEVVKAMYRIGA